MRFPETQDEEASSGSRALASRRTGSKESGTSVGTRRDQSIAGRATLAEQNSNASGCGPEQDRRTGKTILQSCSKQGHVRTLRKKRTKRHKVVATPETVDH